MRFRAHRPGPALSRFIDYLWSLSDAPAHARERIFPSGTLELVVNLAEDAFRISCAPASGGSLGRFPGAIVSGCYAAPFEIDTRAHASIVGVHFKPGGAAAFLGVPPGKLADSHLALDELWGPRAFELRERLCLASSWSEQARILEQILSDQLARGRAPRRAVAPSLVALERPRAEVGSVARELGLSHRRFIELFSEDVGMTPKRYARARRFQRALAMAKGSSAPGWTEIALACGYFDQAHLCREWVELTGVSPSKFAASSDRRVKDNHLALG